MNRSVCSLAILALGSIVLAQPPDRSPPPAKDRDLKLPIINGADNRATPDHPAAVPKVAEAAGLKSAEVTGLLTGTEGPDGNLVFEIKASSETKRVIFGSDELNRANVGLARKWKVARPVKIRGYECVCDGQRFICATAVEPIQSDE